MHPIVQMTIDGQPVAGAFYERLISLSVVDKEGIESDTFDASLNDGPPDFLALPRKGAIAVIQLGYRETGTRQVGRFTVDSVKAKCLPYGLTISGKAADLRKGKLKTRAERHWDGKTLGEIVKEVAGDVGLTARVAPSIAGHRYDWVGQQDETPTHFLERLARRHNALLTVKNGNLVFAERGAGQSAAGSALTPVVITPPLVIDGTLDFEFADRQAFGKVVSYYQDRKQAKRIEVEASGEASSDSVYRIPEPFADAAEADKAAQAKAKQLKRGEGSFSVDVIGDTSIQAGAPLVCEGIRPGLDGVQWLIDSVTHTISKSAGFRSKISAKISDGKSGKAGG